MIDQWSHVLAVSVAPVVMVSATALLCLVFYNRLAAIVGRIRAMQRERIDMQERMDDARTARPERYPALRQTCILESLAEQTTPRCLLGAIATLVVSSLLNGLAVLWSATIVAAAGLFICGMLLFLAGICCAIGEMVVALNPAELEMSIVNELTGEVAA